MSNPLTTVLQRTLFGLALAGAAAVVPSAHAFDASRVNSFCLAGFNAAMSAAGKTPPAGMGEFTCTCFSNRLQQGQSIDQARSACRDEAARRFKVP
jgi:hypothetical protein